MIAAVAVQNIDRVDGIEFVLARICAVRLRYAGIKAAAEQRSQTGFLKFLAVRPLPRIIEVSGKTSLLAAFLIGGAPDGIVRVFRLIVGGIEIIYATRKAGVHDGKILVRQRDIHDEIRLERFDQVDHFLRMVGIDLGGSDAGFGGRRKLGGQTVALLLGAAGDAQIGEYIAYLTAFVNRDGRNAAAANN